MVSSFELFYDWYHEHDQLSAFGSHSPKLSVQAGKYQRQFPIVSLPHLERWVAVFQQAVKNLKPPRFELLSKMQWNDGELFFWMHFEFNFRFLFASDSRYNISQLGNVGFSRSYTYTNASVSSHTDLYLEILSFSLETNFLLEPIWEWQKQCHIPPEACMIIVQDILKPKMTFVRGGRGLC